ncbi:MAG: hypothetical protein QXR28_03735 [Nitrososphaerota archaeon]
MIEKMLRGVSKIISPELFTIRKLDASLAVLLTIFALGFVGSTVYPVQPTAVVGPLETPPSQLYPLGTDAYGKDILAQLIAGIRGSLQIGATAAAISLLIGVLIGLMAGTGAGLGYWLATRDTTPSEAVLRPGTVVIGGPR